MLVIVPVIWLLLCDLWHDYKRSKTLSKPYSDIPAIDVFEREGNGDLGQPTRDGQDGDGDHDDTAE